MFRSNWKGYSGKKKGRQTAPAKFRARPQFALRIESLEGRAMLSGSSLDSGIASDPATHLAIYAPPMALAGTAIPVVVVALDANNVPTSDFTDSISLASSDGTATVSNGASAAGGTAVPYDYTFQSSNNGHQLFFVTYGASGPQTLTASDTTDSAIVDDTADTTVVTPAAATHFAVIVNPNVQAGMPTGVLVEALDANNHPVPNYEGTITLSSSDTAATLDSSAAATVITNSTALPLPQTYTFTAADHGRAQFQVTFNTADAQTTITADDSANSLTGTGTTNVNAAAMATHFAVQMPPNTLAGVPTTVNVLALDANNQVVSNYTGPVTFAVSNDATATLPAGYTFQASDHGHTSFQVTFDTTGPETVTVANAGAVVTGSASTNVVAAPVATQFLVILPPSAPANVPVQGFIVPLDANGRPVPNYTGTVSFSSSDAGATLPANYTFQPLGSAVASSAAGSHSFTVTFATTGTQSVTVTDVTTGTTTGTASTNVTAPQVVSSLQIDAPPVAPVGQTIIVRVDVLDANGNPILDFAGQIALTSNDPAAKIVPLATVLPGGVTSNLFAVTFGTTGSQTLTATDATDSLSTDVSVNVVPGLGGVGPVTPIGPTPPKGPAGPNAPTNPSGSNS